jgi:hypothetical protein
MGIDRPSIGVAMLGYSFMGKAHSRALRALSELDPPLVPELISLSRAETTPPPPQSRHVTAGRRS